MAETRLRNKFRSYQWKGKFDDFVKHSAEYNGSNFEVGIHGILHFEINGIKKQMKLHDWITFEVTNPMLVYIDDNESFKNCYMIVQAKDEDVDL
jgi:hypothetical protein